MAEFVRGESCGLCGRCPVIEPGVERTPMAESPRLRQLQEFLTDSPDDPELRYAVAMELLSLGADEDAVQSFRNFIADQPGYVPSYLMLGQTLIRLNREDEAKDVLRNGVAAARKSGNVHAEGEIQGLLDGLD
jgi:predicted Zn-dependent protease